MTKSPINLVQFTDTHLFGDPEGSLRGVPTLPALRATLAAARDDIAQCDAILVTGDLVQDDPGGYAHFRGEFAALGKPVLCLPGNHDDVPAMRSAAGGRTVPAGWRHSIADPGACCCSTARSPIARAVPSALESLARLDRDLADAGGSPCAGLPAPSPGADAQPLAGHGRPCQRDAFFEVLKRHSNVRAVLFGHVHQALDMVVDGIRVLGTPSTCQQFRPLSPGFATDDAPPALRTLRCMRTGGLIPKLRWVEAEISRAALSGNTAA